MSEKVVEKEIVEEKVEETVEKKPYEFRKLNATDLFAMMKLVKKIGINSFSQILTNKALPLLSGERKAESEQDYIDTGALLFDIGQLLIEKIDDCENEIFNILERTSNLSLEELHHLDMDVFVTMIFDFVKKEEFITFSRAVLKSIK